MKLLVCGGRFYGVGRTSIAKAEQDYLVKVLDDLHAATPVSMLISGDCSGADRLAQEWAQRMSIPTMIFPADWSLGKKAGPIRNARMLVEGQPDLVMAFPGGVGTDSMVRLAKAAKVGVIRADLRRGVHS